MADLKAGTTVGGAMVWTQGNFPLFPSGNTLLYRDYTVYTTNDKPQAADNDFVSKAQGGTFEKTITMKGSISSGTMMQLQGTAVGTQYSLTDSAGALTGSNYQIYAQGDQFKFRAPNTVAAGLIDVLVWTNSTKRYDLSGNLYVSGSIYNLYDSTGGIFYSPKNKPTTTDIGLGNVTNDAQLKIASNLSDVANVDTARTNINAAKSGDNSDITSLTALSSSLRLGADGSNPQDATTLRQMQSAIAAVSSSGGINGVMSTFIGDVSWWAGDATLLPTGYVMPTGQLSLRSDYPEVWALIDAGVLRSTDDATWNSTTTSRGVFTKGTVTSGANANFRWPDLNAGTSGSIGGLFLRGANGPSDAGGIGTIRLSAAPNIVGSTDGNTDFGTNSATGAIRTGNVANNTMQSAGTGASAHAFSFDASRSNAAYGRNGATEVRPNSVSGYWIMRAKGTFSAQTSFNVIASIDTLPASGVLTLGGSNNSVYNVNGTEDHSIGLQSARVVGSNSYASLTVNSRAQGSVSAQSSEFTFSSKGEFGAKTIASETIELSASNPFIDFHYANSTADYTHRIIADTSSRLRVTSALQVDGGVNTTSLTSTGQIYTSTGFVVAGSSGALTQQGTHMRWNESSDGFGSIIVNPGSGSGGMKFRFINSANSAQTGQFTMYANGRSGPSQGHCTKAGINGTLNAGNVFNIERGGDNQNYLWIDTSAFLIPQSTSDLTYKKDITDSKEGALGRVLASKTIEYSWKDEANRDYKRHRGFGAQNQEEIDELHVIPSAGEGYPMSLDNIAMLADAYDAIKSLAAQVDELKSKLEKYSS